MDGSRLIAGAATSWNPLRCDGSALPPGWLLAGKMLALWLFPGRHFLDAGPPFLPFFRILDSPLFAAWLAPAITATFYAAFLCLMFNRIVRTACLVIAGCVLLNIAAHRLAYANNAMFLSVFLIVIGLHDVRTGLWPLRIQLALVYGGACLNKVLDPDWWNGRYFDTLMIDALHVRWYEAVAGRLPVYWLGRVLGATSIATEATIAGTVLVSRDGLMGVALMVIFHAVMLVATDLQLSLVFMYENLALAAAFFYPVLTAWVPRALSPELLVPAMWCGAGFVVRFLPTIRGWI